MSLLSRLAIQASRAYGFLSSRSTNISADYLVVAGGAGGGAVANASGGGGGAGGLLTSTATLSTLNTYSVTVGAGGAGGSNGSNSVLSGTGITTITSTGGGKGASMSYAASSGGSGGGGSYFYYTTGAAGTSGQGYAGGNGSPSTNRTAGGGGGSSSVGVNYTSTAAGNGGNGTASSISGSSVTYAGGGGGGAESETKGTGQAGGGNGGNVSANCTSATANTGSGGGGIGGNQPSSTTFGSGGSGIVIISYTATAPKFVGGTITTSGGKQIHTFTSSGTLSPVTEVTADFLVVAGGGGGGGYSGGGGAGGFRTSAGTSGGGASAESKITLYSPATYIVTVGAGGNGGTWTSTSATNGSDSSLSGTGITTITSTGGGACPTSGSNGNSGGSGGGAAGGSGSNQTGGAGTANQGYKGGDVTYSGAPYRSSGGGGAGAAGSNGGTSSGNGGNGVSSSISGSAVTYAGGGGGGCNNTGTAGSAGTGGGGAGTNSSGTAPSGTVNTGGGGGGSGYSGSGTTGGGGGSGIVIISYAGSQKFNGGTITTSGGNTIHTFYATGALTPVTNNLTNSLRFRSSASAYLNRTPSVASNRRTFTWSAWIKRGSNFGSQSEFFTAGTSGSNYLTFQFDTSNRLAFVSEIPSLVCSLRTTSVYRDPAAWYHVVMAVDTTQATAANRLKLYVNGNQISAFDTATYPSQNTDLLVNSVIAHYFAYNTSGGGYFDGYLADVYFIDGQALEPYYFGSNDSNNIWKPISYYGTYGTNGFRLAFTNTTSTTTIGYDSSPNGNNWTANNISLTAGTTYDAMTDVPTNTSATVANYAVLNPLYSVSASITNANLSLARSGASGYGESTATISPEGNKGYFEITCSSSVDFLVGFIPETTNPNVTNYTSTSCYFYKPYNGNVLVGTGASTSTIITSCTSAATSGQIIMVAFDFTGGNRNVWFGLQGTWGVNASSQTGVPSTGAYPHLTSTQLTTIERFYFSNGDSNTFSINFGQRPFAYTPPTGFVALNTFNLPTPTILQGNKYMDATLYTGNGSTQSITNAAGFKPDLVWIKSRSSVQGHGLYNPLMSGYILDTSSTAAQAGVTPMTFNSNGYTMPDAVYNNNAVTYVGWQWQAGQGSTSSNASGSITSTVSVNATAGFSIVTYTGTGANATVGHGLGVAPKMIIIKSRTVVQNWIVYHAFVGNTGALFLNATNSTDTNSVYWQNTTPTSTVFSLGTNLAGNTNGSTNVAYCFAEIAGFSKFGSYTGNGSTDGPFVYLGFRPKYILIKNSSSGTTDWFIFDSSRSTYNLNNLQLLADTSAAETTGASSVLDFVSNGIKLRGTGADVNGNGNTMIYMAFAETPFKYSNSR